MHDRGCLDSINGHADARTAFCVDGVDEHNLAAIVPSCLAPSATPPRLSKNAHGKLPKLSPRERYRPFHHRRRPVKRSEDVRICRRQRLNARLLTASHASPQSIPSRTQEEHLRQLHYTRPQGPLARRSRQSAAGRCPPCCDLVLQFGCLEFVKRRMWQTFHDKDVKEACRSFVWRLMLPDRFGFAVSAAWNLMR